ncbi:ATP-binding protein, partial [Candidatus Margulisiibacteriota bacterium]
CSKEDEIGSLAKTFKYLMEGIYATITQANSISKGDFDIIITPKSDKDFLSITIGNMKNAIVKRELKIKEKLKEISDILNAIEQGIITINPDLSINPEHSRKAEEIFASKDFSKLKIEDIFNLSNVEKDKLANWIKVISDPERLQNFKHFSALSPLKELKLQNRVLKVDYQPIIEDASLNKLMILAQDITEQRRAEELVTKTKKEQELQMQRVLNIINQDQDMLSTFFNEGSRLLQNYENVSNLNNIQKNLNIIYREIHTLEGTGGSLGFVELAKKAAIAEDFLIKLRDRSQKSADEIDISEWKKAVEGVKKELQSLQTTQGLLFKDKGDGFYIKRKEYNNVLADLLKGKVLNLSQIFLDIYNLDAHTFQDYAKKYQNIVNIYKAKNKKDIDELEVISGKERIHRELMQIFDPAIVHLVRNSLAHGIETGGERKKKGKGVGHISIGLKYITSNINIIVSDDGGGIDPKYIAQKAVEKGLISQAQAKNMSEQEKLDLIFKSGFSTSKTIDSTSGRGVGMDAVLAHMKEYNGNVFLTTEIGKGTSITLTLPIELHVKSFVQKHSKSAKLWTEIEKALAS